MKRLSTVKKEIAQSINVMLDYYTKQCACKLCDEDKKPVEALIVTLAALKGSENNEEILRKVHSILRGK